MMVPEARLELARPTLKRRGVLLLFFESFQQISDTKKPQLSLRLFRTILTYVNDGTRGQT